MRYEFSSVGCSLSPLYILQTIQGSENMQFPVNHFIETHHIRIWRLIAILQGHNSKWSTTQTIVVNAFLCIMFLCCLSFLLNVLESNTNDFQNITNSLILCVLSIVFTAKYWLFRSQRARFLRLFELVIQMEAMLRPTNRFEQSLIENGTKHMRRIGIACWTFCGVATFGWILACICGADRTLLFPTNLPSSIDWHQNDLVFALCNVWIFLNKIFVIVVAVPVECFGPNLFMILYVYLQILGQRISKIGWPKNLDEKSQLHSETFHAEIIACIT